MKRKLPIWCKEVKKAMIDKDMTVGELAESVGLTREHVSSVINGRLLSPNTQNAICEFLNLELIT